MGIVASDTGGKEFKKVPPGAHFAVCNMVVDLGIQATTFKGQEKQQHKVYLRWEVPDERVTWQDKDGKEHEGPASIGATYTLSLSEKAKLRAVLENWRGKLFTKDELRGFDITTVAGKPCQIMVSHSTGADGKTYANVTTVMSVSKDQKERARAAKSEIGVTVFSLDDPDKEAFDKLPNWIKEKLEDRIPEPSIKAATALPDNDFDDDLDKVPF